MQVQTAQHEWTEMVVTPVEVIEVDGELVQVSTGAEPKVAVGCFKCDTPLDEGFGTPCEGIKDQSAP